MSSNHNTVETALGGVVLLVAATFLTIALSHTSFKTTTGYTVNANFAKADGINAGMDVRLSGVKIGSVAGLSLDPKTYLANVSMTIENNIQLPTDTVAKVASESLLGGKYLTLEPGADDAMIKSGGRIQFTQSAVNLEDLIGKFIFNGADKAGDKAGDKAKDPATANSALADPGMANPDMANPGMTNPEAAMPADPATAAPAPAAPAADPYAAAE